MDTLCTTDYQDLSLPFNLIFLAQENIVFYDSPAKFIDIYGITKYRC
jgi:hypothetical protein